MGGQLREHRAPGWRRSAGPGASTVLPAGPWVPAGPIQRVLQLQRQIGNRAVVHLLNQAGPPGTAVVPGAPGGRVGVQRTPATPEFAPVGTLTPAGSLTEAQWTAAFKAARAAPSPVAFEPLIRDIAITAGMESLGAGFVPTRVPLTDGSTARPGLNMSMDPADKPGHAGWVDGSGTFGVGFKLDRTKPSDRQIAIILSAGILKEDKGLSLHVVRHEMVHARHKQKVLEAVKAWQALPARGRPSFGDWLKQQAGKKKNPMSALNAVLIDRGVQDLSVNTEALAYVEGFVNSYHRRLPTLAAAGPSFFELLGVVQTDKFEIWEQADPTVKAEVLTRLREYHATLGLAHQKLWKQWLDRQLTVVGKDKHRKDFLTRLGAFVT